MAEQRDKLDQLTTTQLDSFVKWGQAGSNKGQKFTALLLNDMYQFSIQNQGETGKFDGEKLAVTFSNLDEAALVNTLKEMLRRLSDIVDNNKKVEKCSLVIHNGRTSIKDATSKLEFNCYTNDNPERGGAFSGYIKVGKKEKQEDQNFKELTMWFGNGKNIYRNSESKPSTDLEIYSNLQSLLYKMEACLAKSSLARDAHLKKHLAKLYSDNNQNKGSESSGPKNKGNYKSYANSSNDDDDFPY